MLPVELPTRLCRLESRRVASGSSLFAIESAARRALLARKPHTQSTRRVLAVRVILLHHNVNLFGVSLSVELL